MSALAAVENTPAPRVWLLTCPATERPGKSRARSSPRRAAVQIILAAGALLCMLILALGFTVVSRGVQLFVIDGDGLEPAIPAGALLVVDPLSDRGGAVGELLVLSEDQVPSVVQVLEVVHGDEGRIYRVLDPGVGDGQVRAVSAAALLGRIAFYLPGVAPMLEAMSQPFGRATAAALAAAVLLWRALPLIRRDGRRIRTRWGRATRAAGVSARAS